MTTPGRHLITETSCPIDVKDGKFFFDTNIWMFLYGPFLNPADKRAVTYSHLLRIISENNGRILIDALVLAEFVNRYVRDNHRALAQAGQADQNFKVFRRTVEYADIVQNVGDEVYHILSMAEKVNFDFCSEDILSCMDDLSSMDTDFNDVVFGRICAAVGSYFVTDDADCAGFSVPIISANKRLVSPMGSRNV